MILVIDNYDSFVFNLARYCSCLGFETRVVRNDRLTISQIREMAPQAIIISPGPCTPNEAGISLETVRQLGESIPILGVCLGHQAIVQAFGGTIGRAKEPMHGRTSLIRHTGDSLFETLPSPLRVCRYHSLIAVDSEIPPCLQVTARTSDDVVMAVEHRSAPVFGLQFHPEAILTEGGYTMLNNFFRRAAQCHSDNISDTSTAPKSRAQLEALWQREFRGATDGTATAALATGGKVEMDAMPQEAPEPVAAHPDQWFPTGGSGASTWRPSP